jgi:hypothetical protein
MSRNIASKAGLEHAIVAFVAFIPRFILPHVRSDSDTVEVDDEGAVPQYPARQWSQSKLRHRLKAK